MPPRILNHGPPPAIKKVGQQHFSWIAVLYLMNQTWSKWIWWLLTEGSTQECFMLRPARVPGSQPSSPSSCFSSIIKDVMQALPICSIMTPSALVPSGFGSPWTSAFRMRLRCWCTPLLYPSQPCSFRPTTNAKYMSSCTSLRSSAVGWKSESLTKWIKSSKIGWNICIGGPFVGLRPSYIYSLDFVALDFMIPTWFGSFLRWLSWG